MLTRERPHTSVRALMPAPAPLPSPSDALARRAAVFGPFDGHEAPAACCEREQDLRLERPNFDTGRRGCGRSNFVQLRRDRTSHHARVLRQHDIGGRLYRPSMLLGLATVLVAHLCLLCWCLPA